MASEETGVGHPRGLTVLFLTNMWEQFSYYGMRALLVYYMTKQLLLTQGTSSLIYGVYTACAYFTPLIGGIIADRALGKKRAIILGGSVMALGHFMMTVEPLFYVALATIAIGNGLFLPSLPSQIRDLYQRHVEQRLLGHHEMPERHHAAPDDDRAPLAKKTVRDESADQRREIRDAGVDAVDDR